MFYVGRSLAPITELTQHAASMARRVTQARDSGSRASHHAA